MGTRFNSASPVCCVERSYWRPCSGLTAGSMRGCWQRCLALPLPWATLWLSLAKPWGREGLRWLRWGLGSGEPAGKLQKERAWTGKYGWNAIEVLLSTRFFLSSYPWPGPHSPPESPNAGSWMAFMHSVLPLGWKCVFVWILNPVGSLLQRKGAAAK